MLGRGLDRIGGCVAACLAALALFLLVAVPPGVMVEPSDGGPRIVVCTGHGPLLVGSPESSKPGKAPKQPQSGVCAFAGHGGSGAIPSVFAPTPACFARVARAAITERDLAPGRGLAAPPPPSHAPPRLTI
jgi:hypothetical protein